MKRWQRSLVAGIGIIVALIAGQALLFKPVTPASQGVGVQDVVVADPADKPLAVRIWVPNDPASLKLAKLPLIVISHGTGGNLSGHTDTAMALAKAGFVVAALNHTGDNTQDQGYIAKGRQLMGRPRHVSELLTYMLMSWSGHARLDANKIGIFGHSAGGLTALVLAGGKPDIRRVAADCRAHPDDWGCLWVAKHGFDPQLTATQAPIDWVPDSRIRAAAIAAPALGFTFEADSLAHITIPVQIWAAEHDVVVNDSPMVIARSLPHQNELHLIKNAGHFAFLSPCNRIERGVIWISSLFGNERICDDAAGFDRAKFHDAFNSAIIAFFQKSLGVMQP